MFKKLVIGELKRLQKYNVTLISLLIVMMWSALLYFIEDASLFQMILPLLVVIDITVMALLYAGAILFFEKTESTLFAMLVTPASHRALILSKVVANIIHQVIATSLVVIVFSVLKSISIPWLPLIIVMTLSVGLHTLLGFFFTFTSKDFTGMLTNVMVVMIVLTIPTILAYVDVFSMPDWLSYVMLLNPFESVFYLVQSVFTNVYDFKSWLAIFLVVVWFYALLTLYVEPGFKRFVQKGSGV
jgi:fluoroquinolone transport system permease protein